VVSTLAAAAKKQNPSADITQELQQNLSGFFAMCVKNQPNLKRIKFNISKPALAVAVWSKKKHMPRKVYLEVYLTPDERRNRKVLYGRQASKP
jgi:hypothetical protein